MSGNTVKPVIGYFGKVPARGDFIQDNLSSDFVDGWREWLQAVMAVSKEQLGKEWLGCYLTSPVWHFALSPGICGVKTVIGTLMPSIDQVGRHFYFTLATEVEGPPVGFWSHREWSSESEQKVLELLDDGTDLNNWVEAINSAEWFSPDTEASSPLKINATHSGHLIVTAQQKVSSDQLLHKAYRDCFERYCFWWTSGSERITPCTLVTKGLPLVSQFAAMLDGEWEQWGW